MSAFDLVVLSPHLDDAAFSCGGSIARASAAGEKVAIVTFATADAATVSGAAALSPFARELHALWQRGDRPYEARRQEDLEASARLGAEAVHLGALDAIYRRLPDGRPVVASGRELFRPAPPGDPGAASFAAAFAGWWSAQGPVGRVLAPLGIGGHLDHRLVHALAASIAGTAVEYYEDFPYSARRRWWLRALWPGRWLWRTRVVALRPEDLERRIAAMKAFTSQLALWKNSEAMATAVRGQVTARNGERLWRRGFSRASIL